MCRRTTDNSILYSFPADPAGEAASPEKAALAAAGREQVLHIHCILTRPHSAAFIKHGVPFGAMDWPTSSHVIGCRGVSFCRPSVGMDEPRRRGSAATGRLPGSGHQRTGVLLKALLP